MPGPRMVGAPDKPTAVVPTPNLPAVRPARRPTTRAIGWLRWPLIAALAIAAAVYAAQPLLFGPRVAVYAAQRRDLVATVVASGRVQTPYRAGIGSQITGTVAYIPVAEGQTVKKGQVLVVLQSDELSSSANQAQGAVAEAGARLAQIHKVTLPAAREALIQASANLADSRKTYERQRTLLAQGFTTKSSFDDAQRNLDTAEAQERAAQLQVRTNSPGGSDYLVAQTALAQATSSLAAAKARLSYTVIKAPSDGVLIARDVERGDVVAPGKTLMVLSPNAETQLLINVDEKNLSQLSLGQSAVASADAFPNRRFAARVAYINPGVDATTATVEVKLIVPSPPAYLRQDMTVSVDILTATRQHTLVLPADGVMDAFTDHPYVLRVDHGRARAAPVSLGVRGGGAVEILGGVREGDLVVPATAKVAAGERIRAYRRA